MTKWRPNLKNWIRIMLFITGVVIIMLAILTQNEALNITLLREVAPFPMFLGVLILAAAFVRPGRKLANKHNPPVTESGDFINFTNAGKLYSVSTARLRLYIWSVIILGLSLLLISGVFLGKPHDAKFYGLGIFLGVISTVITFVALLALGVVRVGLFHSWLSYWMSKRLK